jgi:hypothetical protein
MLLYAFPSLLLVLACCASAAPFSSWAGKRSGYGNDGPLMRGSGPGAAASNDGRSVSKFLSELNSLYAAGYPRQQVMEDEDAAFPYASAAQQKRAPFSSWAGKRAPFSSWAGKRAPFSSWAGKRSASMLEEEPAEQEMMMSGHRFKRSSAEEGDDEEDEAVHTRDRRGANSFSAWGGKRNHQLKRFTRNAPNGRSMSLVPVRVLRPSRAAFSAWGGR